MSTWFLMQVQLACTTRAQYQARFQVLGKTSQGWNPQETTVIGAQWSTCCALMRAGDGLPEAPLELPGCPNDGVCATDSGGAAGTKKDGLAAWGTGVGISGGSDALPPFDALHGTDVIL